MIMTEDITAATQLLRELVESIIDHPAHLVIAIDDDNSGQGEGVHWTMRVHADDHRRVVGKQGAHIRALTMIMAEIGRNGERDFLLHLLEATAGVRNYNFSPKKIVSSYDAKPSHELLLRTAASVCHGQVSLTRVQCIGLPLTFVFTLHVQDRRDYDELITPEPHDKHRQTLIGALGTIWRAAASRDGVKFAIEARPPS